MEYHKDSDVGSWIQLVSYIVYLLFYGEGANVLGSHFTSLNGSTKSVAFNITILFS